MSNIFITDIIGQNDFAVPDTDAKLATATVELDALLTTVAGLVYDRALAWVETKAGAGAFRTLNCLIEKFYYNGEECPDATEVVTMTAAIKAKLEGDADITSIADQQVHIFQAGAYHLWQRDAAGGFLYPNTITDDVAVGGHVAPTGKWFDDGDLVLGGNTMVGTEKLLVIGSQLIDQNGNGYGLDIDSEATGQPLINLQPILTNTRGDIAFGTTRTSDPSGPSEGDLWYNATDNCLKYYDGTEVICTKTYGRYAYGASEGVSTTTSTTFQQKLRVSVTGISSGSYIVYWTFTYYRSGSAARNFEAQVQVDDTTTLWTMVANEADTGSNQLYPAAAFRDVTLTSGNHDFDIDYRISGPGATAGISQVRLTLWRVA